MKKNPNRPHHSILKHSNAVENRRPYSTPPPIIHYKQVTFSPIRAIRFFHDDETGTVYSDQIDDTTEKRIDEFTNEIITKSNGPAMHCTTSKRNEITRGVRNKKIKRKRVKFYTVQKILGHRIRGGQAEFLIKWQGYGDAYNTWEPASNLDEKLVEEINKLLQL